MKKALHYSIVLLFLSYWLITIIYTSPNNYVKIKCQKTNDFMEKYFFQQWNFFAPPADFDQRLHVSFYTQDSTQIISFEVLEDILCKKRLYAPFNHKEQYTDYLLSGTLNLVNDGFVEFLKEKEFDSTYTSKIKTIEEKVGDFEKNLIKTNSPIYTLLTSTLKNYKSFYKSNKDIYYGKLTITQKPLPTFEKRNLLLDTTYCSEEKVAFVSSLIKL